MRRHSREREDGVALRVTRYLLTDARREGADPLGLRHDHARIVATTAAVVIDRVTPGPSRRHVGRITRSSSREPQKSTVRGG